MHHKKTSRRNTHVH